MDSRERTSRPGPCPLPLLHRAYQATVVGVAVFFAVNLLLREPFRGYQTEVRLAGPTGFELDLADLKQWVKQRDSSAAVALSGGQGNQPREIRIGKVAPRLPGAFGTLEELSRQVLADYLPRVHSEHKQRQLAELESGLERARAAERELEDRMRELSRAQVSRERFPEQPPASPAVGSSDTVETAQPAPPDEPQLAAGAPDAESADLLGELSTLRRELSRLLANFTEEHPQVVALQRQIDQLQERIKEQSQASGASPPAAEPQFAADSNTSFTRFPAARFAEDRAAAAPADREELERLASQLAAATALRHTSERQLHTALTSLALDSATAGWTPHPPRLVARLGGTPRMLPLILSNIAGIAAGLAMFKLTTILAAKRVLSTTAELSRALPIPLIGSAPLGNASPSNRRQAWITPARLHLASRLSELWLVALGLVFGAATCLDSTLAAQIPGDPLGVLSEIVGRIAGG